MKYSYINKSKCHCITLCRAANAVNAYYDEHFQKAGISTKQYSLLTNLSRIGEASTSELAAYVNLERSTLVRNLKVLKENGWISDLAGEGRRTHRYVVTAAGQEKMEETEPIWRKVQQEMEEMVGKEQMETMTEVLYKIQELQRK